MCTECTHLSKIQWVSDTDVSKVQSEFQIEKGGRDPKNEPRYYFLADFPCDLLRFDDLVTCIEKEEGSQVARRVESEMVERGMVRH